MASILMSSILVLVVTLMGPSLFSMTGCEATSEGLAPQETCNRLDCPSYTLVDSNPFYEVREYSPSTWISTDATCTNLTEYRQTKRALFYRLLRYIKGANADGQKIAMTAPGTKELSLGPDPSCPVNFTLSFYMSESVTPSLPTEETVYIRQAGRMKFYVRSFEVIGWPDQETFDTERSALSDLLVSQGLDFVAERYLTAGYDKPSRTRKRHNEIWLIAKE